MANGQAGTHESMHSNQPGVSVVDEAKIQAQGQSIWDMYNQRQRDFFGNEWKHDPSIAAKQDREREAVVPKFFSKMLGDIAAENPGMEYGGQDFWKQWHEKEGTYPDMYEGKDTLDVGALHPYWDMETIFNMNMEGLPIFNKKEDFLKARQDGQQTQKLFKDNLDYKNNYRSPEK